MRRTVLLTGSTGLVGGATLRRIIGNGGDVDVYVLIRRPDDWSAAAARLGVTGMATPVIGDIGSPLCGMSTATLRHLAGRVTHVLHAAADTSFAQTWENAYATNAMGAQNMVAVAERLPLLDRFVQVSTAFVAGCRTGIIPEGAPQNHGFVNAYERSKFEAEEIVRRSGLPWTIARCALIACDDETGYVSQLNALHRSLGMIHAGLVKVLPGSPDTVMDLTTADYTSHALEHLLLARHAHGETLHLCAGANGITIGDLLETSFRVWSRSAAWRSRGIAMPGFVDLAAYHAHEYHVERNADRRTSRAVAALRHFVPQLAFPKRFETSCAEDILGYAAEPVSGYWRRVVERVPVDVSRAAVCARNRSAHRDSIRLVS